MYYSDYYISESNAENIAKKLRISEGKAELRTFSEGNKLNVFMSHRHDEENLVRYIKTILESLNSKVYIDWEDASMPPNPNGDTARKLKEKIRKLDKFIYVASNGAINSKWCNWELGYGDAYKSGSDKIVIFPVRNEYEWKGSEYLKIYPRIVFIPDLYKILRNDNMNFGNPAIGKYWVVYPNDDKVELINWLQK